MVDFEESKSNNNQEQRQYGIVAMQQPTRSELELVDICNLDLDIFALAKRNTRKRTFVTMTKRFLDTSLQFVPEITEESVTRFLETIW